MFVKFVDDHFWYTHRGPHCWYSPGTHTHCHHTGTAWRPALSSGEILQSVAYMLSYNIKILALYMVPLNFSPHPPTSSIQYILIHSPWFLTWFSTTTPSPHSPHTVTFTINFTSFEQALKYELLWLKWICTCSTTYQWNLDLVNAEVVCTM